MITWKLTEGAANLRCGVLLDAFKESARGAKAFGFGILHFSILKNHAHLVAEAKDNESLGNGARSFGCRFAKAVRKKTGGSGPVFAGRYHLRVLKNPTEVRNALQYVLQNRAKHENLIPHLDEYSSAPFFRDWRVLLGKKMGPVISDVEERLAKIQIPGYLAPPRSWLAREGWKKARMS